jgi:hypothetical protein
MKLLMVRQTLVTGTGVSATGVGFNSVLSSLILNPSAKELRAV